MKRYSLQDFDSLNLWQRSQLIFSVGNFIAKRRQDAYILALFEVKKELFEVGFHDQHNAIEYIERHRAEQLVRYADDLIYAVT